MKQGGDLPSDIPLPCQAQKAAQLPQGHRDLAVPCVTDARLCKK